MRQKKLPSLQFVITDRMSLLLLPSLNGRSIPLNINKLGSQGLPNESSMIKRMKDKLKKIIADFKMKVYGLTHNYA
jgi:hypothetical protein